MKRSNHNLLNMSRLVAPVAGMLRDQHGGLVLVVQCAAPDCMRQTRVQPGSGQRSCDCGEPLVAPAPALAA